jgi:hypothetical protein
MLEIVRAPARRPRQRLHAPSVRVCVDVGAAAAASNSLLRELVERGLVTAWEMTQVGVVVASALLKLWGKA